MAEAFQGDIEERRYPQRVVLQVVGLDAETLKNWLKRGALADPREDYLEPIRVAPVRGPRRLYSALDIIKLTCIARLVEVGLPIGIAAQVSGNIDNALTREDLDAIAAGTVADYPVIVGMVNGQLQVIFSWSEYWSRLPFGDDSRTNPLAAMDQAEVEAALILHWPRIVRSVLEKLAGFEGG